MTTRQYFLLITFLFAFCLCALSFFRLRTNLYASRNFQANIYYLLSKGEIWFVSGIYKIKRANIFTWCGIGQLSGDFDMQLEEPL